MKIMQARRHDGIPDLVKKAGPKKSVYTVIVQLDNGKHKALRGIYRHSVSLTEAAEAVAKGGQKVSFEEAMAVFDHFLVDRKYNVEE